MASSALKTFTCFPRLPVELQKQVWEQAAADLPLIDIQRFRAEITVSQNNTNREGEPPTVLCLTPHSDFINLTTGHRGLLGACKESRQAARRQIDCLLPIYYSTVDANGVLIPRRAFVPFNTSGEFCVGGLGRAFEAADYGRGSRGYQLPELRLSRYWFRNTAEEINGLEGTTTPLIKHLTIALDPVSYSHSESITRLMHRLEWRDKALDSFFERLPNLETVSLIGEAALDRRHQIDQNLFKRMHRAVSVSPNYVASFPRNSQSEDRRAPWKSLWELWERQKLVFYAITRNQIDEIDRRQSQDPDESGSVDVAADAARRQQLELNLSAVMSDLWKEGRLKE